MSHDYHSQIDELLEQAWALGQTPARLALEEEAVRIADNHQDLDEGYHLRDNLITTAIFSGFPEKALVAFSWMLAQSDRAPERFPEVQLLWKYKWIVNNMDNFPQISCQQIEDALADMEKRYRRCGRSLKPVWKERVKIARAAGRREEARDCYRRWRDARADVGNDCAACDRNFQFDYLLFMGRLRQGLKVAEPLLERRQGCSEVPHVTFANALLPLMKLGELDRAAECHRTGYPMIASNRVYIVEVADHIVYLMQVGNHDKAVQLLEKHFLWALETMQLSRQFQFYLAALFLLKQLEEAGTFSLKLRLPKEFPLHSDDGDYEITALTAWFDQQTKHLAQQFDQRNGTDHFTRRLARPDGEWKDLVQENAPLF